jgi:Threonyl-tRNA synthetase
MPEKFDLSYIGEDNRKYRPVVIHRAVFGSIDRFIGILTENYGGAFPLWLAPVQVKLLPVSDQYMDYALQVKSQLEDAGIRVEIDGRNEKLGYKIREAELEKVPYMLILGEKEVTSGTAAVRKRGQGDLGSKSVQEIASLICEEIHEKK